MTAPAFSATAPVPVQVRDGRTVLVRPTALASGAEKQVFLSVDGREVVAFYFGALRDRLERRQRLERIVSSYDPARGAAAAYWQDAFCWPSGVVDGAAAVPAAFARAWSLAQPPLGVVMPVYRPGFFMQDRFGNRVEKEVRWFTGRKAAALVPDVEQGTLLTRLQACVRIARAVRRLHFAGLAHSDLSNRNVLVDLRTGDACVIDIDALVVPGLAPPTVLGTPGYIAPEVLAGRALPSIETDRHALAVLIYELLLRRHPLRGTKVHSTVSAEEDERLSMGERALFVEHSSDRGNPPEEPIRHAVSVLGPHLERLMRRAFEEGVHAPSRRPDAVEWEDALYRTLERVHPTPSGRGFMLVWDEAPHADPWSGEQLHRAVPLLHGGMVREGAVVPDGTVTTLFHHRTLHRWHLEAGVRPSEEAPRDPEGYVSFHQGEWWVVNLSGRPWQVRNGDAVAHQAPLVLRPGLEVEIPARRDDQPARHWRVVFTR